MKVRSELLERAARYLLTIHSRVELASGARSPTLEKIIGAKVGFRTRRPLAAWREASITSLEYYSPFLVGAFQESRAHCWWQGWPRDWLSSPLRVGPL